MLIEHFDKVKMSFTSGNFPTTWEGLLEGILTVCTMSEVLIAAAMNLIVKSVEKQRRGPLVPGIRQPLIRTFTDNLTVTAKSNLQGERTLEESEKIIKWTRMKFRTPHSRSLLLIKDNVIGEAFNLADEIYR